MRAGVIASTAAITLLAACATSSPELPPPPSIGSPDQPGDSAEVSDSAESAMPEVITEDLAREILTELEAADAIFWRWLIDSEVGEQPPDWARAALEAAYAARLVEPLLANLLQTHEEQDGVHSGLHLPYGQYRPATLEVLRADPTCPLLSVSWDGSEVESEEASRPRSAELIALVFEVSNTATDVSGWRYRLIARRGDYSDEQIQGELRDRGLCQ